MYLHRILQHLDKPNTFVRSVFVDFSSAFNTIRPNILVQKLVNMHVNCKLIQWIFNYLCDRPQVVRMADSISSKRIVSTGAPQGCVLSPVLFCLYTNDCKTSSNQCHLIKYADDTVLTGFLYGDDSTVFDVEVQKFTNWCMENNLTLNISKTKEIVYDFRRSSHVHNPLMFNGEVVERVESYKYLGTHIDSRLSWNTHAKVVKRKASQRLYFLRKLNECRVDRTIMKLFYESVIQSVLTFNFICFFGSMPKKHKLDLDRFRKSAERCIGLPLATLDCLYEQTLSKKLSSIMRDSSHPFHDLIGYNRSGIRLLVPVTRTARFRQTFLPEAIHHFNSNARR